MSDYVWNKKPATFVDFGLTPEEEERAKALHKQIIVFDALVEVSYYDGFIENCQKGGLTVGSYSIGVAGLAKMQGRTTELLTKPRDWWSAEALVKDIAFVYKLIHERPDELMLCLNVADVHKAKEVGKLGFFLDVQNSDFLTHSFENLSTFYDMGLRRIQLTYSTGNYAGTGCSEPMEGGLTLWGRDLVKEVNKLGMLVDTGHCSSQTAIDAAEVSSAPITCSHAGMKSRVPNSTRTMTDEAIKAIADRGGVFGVVSAGAALVGQDKCTIHHYLDTIEAG